ncbi:hypothetical protein CPB83DRAFT_802835 [Crepidotus variabilis]|uniref:F-box/LRR-repeat protein 15-like leucin rich repeat domain-containing protein n=1 Tax=Crepidotus variabilis TaxID=179855 RepID=A0A9P6ERE0_9AGAR|nr:hypothetical protein CPB83DRAFT_802835 [Crepidotus variabilis]
MLAGGSASASSLSSFHEDMIKIIDRLPTEDEYRRVRHLILQQPNATQAGPGVTDEQVALVLPFCPHLETVVLTGVPDTTDRTIVLLAENAINLLGLNLSGCAQVTDVGVLEITNKSLPLHWLMLNGVVGLTDPSISAIAKTCSRLVELEVCDMPLLTPVAVRDIWSFSRKLRTLRLCNNPLLSDKAFPSASSRESTPDISNPLDKPLPHRPTTWLEQLPPLILRHTADNLRVLDLTSCKITDEAMEGIVSHAPRIQSLNLTRCSLLTDQALESISKLQDHLDVLMLAYVTNITDRGLVHVARSCGNLRCVDVAFCRNLTDMSVFELAGLPGLRRLSLVRVHKLTDIAVFSLAEHATGLERLHLSYCDHLSLDSIHLLLRKLENLQHFTATGIPALRRKGIGRFSEASPANYDSDQKAAFCVFNGENVVRLRRFLDKEDKRRREAEAKNIPYIPRADDKSDLY